MHTPIITGSDCEGAGEMFRATTLDLEKTTNKRKRKNRLHKGFFWKAC